MHPGDVGGLGAHHAGERREPFGDDLVQALLRAGEAVDAEVVSTRDACDRGRGGLLAEPLGQFGVVAGRRGEEDVSGVPGVAEPRTGHGRDPRETLPREPLPVPCRGRPRDAECRPDAGPLTAWPDLQRVDDREVQLGQDGRFLHAGTLRCRFGSIRRTVMAATLPWHSLRPKQSGRVRARTPWGRTPGARYEATAEVSARSSWRWR